MRGGAPGWLSIGSADVADIAIASYQHPRNDAPPGRVITLGDVDPLPPLTLCNEVGWHSGLWTRRLAAPFPGESTVRLLCPHGRECEGKHSWTNDDSTN